MATRLVNNYIHNLLSEDVELDWDQLDPRFGDIGFPEGGPGYPLDWEDWFRPPGGQFDEDQLNPWPFPVPKVVTDNPELFQEWLDSLQDWINDQEEEEEEEGPEPEPTQYYIPPYLDPTHEDFGTNPNAKPWHWYIPRPSDVGDFIRDIDPIWTIPLPIPGRLPVPDIV